jgi:hypothetical protein
MPMSPGDKVAKSPSNLARGTRGRTSSDLHVVCTPAVRGVSVEFTTSKPISPIPGHLRQSCMQSICQGLAVRFRLIERWHPSIRKKLWGGAPIAVVVRQYIEQKQAPHKLPRSSEGSALSFPALKGEVCHAFRSTH